MPRKLNLTDEQKLDVIKQYSIGVSGEKLAKKYNICSGSIFRILRKNNINIRKGWCRSRKYSINESFFESIDNELSAYFLGFLFADGYNCVKKHYVTLGLAEQDKYILDKFTSILQPTKPLLFIKSNILTHQNRYTMKIHNKKISNDLNKLGCVQCKTFKLTYPTIPTCLNNHFIRGYFDGDGCISIDTGGYNCPRWEIMGTGALLRSIQNILISNLNINITKLLTQKRINGNILVLTYGGRFNVLKICDWLYNNATICLPRKYKKYTSISRKGYTK